MGCFSYLESVTDVSCVVSSEGSKLSIRRCFRVFVNRGRGIFIFLRRVELEGRKEERGDKS